MRPIVFSTLVQDDLREIVKRATACSSISSRASSVRSSASSRCAPRIPRAARTAWRISPPTPRASMRPTSRSPTTTARAGDYARADVMLIGVSRSGKTPTCLYMALQYGIFAANYPLTEDELESRQAAADAAARTSASSTGSRSSPSGSQQIRNERRPDSRYASRAAGAVRGARGGGAVRALSGFRSSKRPSAPSRKSRAASSINTGLERRTATVNWFAARNGRRAAASTRAAKSLCYSRPMITDRPLCHLLAREARAVS